MKTKPKKIPWRILDAAGREMTAKDKDPSRHWTERICDPENQQNYAVALERLLQEESVRLCPPLRDSTLGMRTTRAALLALPSARGKARS